MKVSQHNTAWLNNSLFEASGGWSVSLYVQLHPAVTTSQPSSQLKMRVRVASASVALIVTDNVFNQRFCLCWRVMLVLSGSNSYLCRPHFNQVLQWLISVSARGLTSLTTSNVSSDAPCCASSDTSIYTNKLLTFAQMDKINRNIYHFTCEYFKRVMKYDDLIQTLRKYGLRYWFYLTILSKFDIILLWH